MAGSGLSVKYDPGVYVDTIHLNVGVGDCSIVCKYELLSGDDTGPNRMLKSAVIIDGGFQSAAGVIKKCITQQLGGLYNLTEMGGSVKFDSVVITHWDRDHWGGVVNLIVADLIAQLKQTVDMVVAAATAAAGARGLTEEQIQKIEGQVVAANTAPNFNATDPTVPRIQSSYFKYDGPPGTGKPLTTLYVPYWDVNYKSGSRHGPKATMNNSNRMLSLNGNWGAVFDLDIKPVAGTPRSWILSLCRLNETAAKNLGKDLLRPPGLTRPISVFLQNSTSTGPQNLASFLGLAGPITGPEGDIPEPALVIVACAEDGVWNYGKPATKAVVQASRSESVAQAHPFGSVKIVDEATASTIDQNTNKASIACVVLWGNGHVSHYLAGDAYHEQEAPLIDFLSKGVTADWIGAVKLSHHGAATSSPATLFTRLVPRTVIASAGTMHGHPRWELVLWIDLFRRTFGSRAESMFILPTIYPYWLLPAAPLVSSDNTGNPTVTTPEPPFVRGLKVSVKAFYAGTSNTAVNNYQAQIQTMLDEINRRTRDPNNPFAPNTYRFRFGSDPGGNDNNNRAQRQWLYNHMTSIWDCVSIIDAQLGSYGVPVDVENVISYWRVVSSSTWTTDGNAFGKRVDYSLEDLESIPGVLTHNKEIVQILPPRSEITRAGRAFAATKALGLKGGLTANQAGILSVVESVASGEHEAEGDPGDLDVTAAATGVKIARNMDRSVGRVLIQADAPASSPPVQPLALPTNHYFICASSILTSGSNALRLELTDTGARSALDVFLDGLESGMLVAQSAPDSVGQVLLPGTADFPDSLCGWMSASLNADSVLVQGIPDLPNSPSQSPVTGFVVSITAPLLLTGSTPAPFPQASAMQFTTAAFVPDPDIKPAPVMPFGYLPLLNLLTLGLDLTSGHTTLQSMTLADLLSFIGMDSSRLQTLGGAINLTLDTDPKARNTLWFVSQPSYQAIMRLQFKLTDETTFRSFFTTIAPKLTLSNIRVIGRKFVSKVVTSTGFDTTQQPQLITTVAVTPPDSATALDASFIFAPNVITLVIRPQDGTLAEMLGWLALLMGLDDVDNAAVLDVENWVAKVSSNTVTIRELRLAICNSKLQTFSLDLEVDVDFGQSPESTGKVAFFFSYTYSIFAPNHTVSGYLFTPSYPAQLNVVDQSLFIDYETYNATLKPSDTYSESLYASNILDSLTITNVPQELDLEITRLTFSLASDQFTFEGSMAAKADADPTKASHFSLQLVTVSATWIFAVKDAAGDVVTPATYDVSLSTQITLEAADPDENAAFMVSIAYNTPTWDLSASIEDLKMSALVSLFPDTDGTTVMDIMDHFEINNLYMDYKYDTSGTGGSFNIQASLLLDIFILDFAFNWTKTPAEWDIFATLTLAPTVQTDLVSVLKAALKDPTIAGLIPNFANFTIDGGKSSVELIVKKGTNPVDQTEAIVFALSLLIKGSSDEPDIRVSFVQTKTLAATSSGSGSATASIKRIIRISVNSIPWSAVPNIPMVGSLKQPFNEIDYAWVHDDGTGAATTLGLTRANIAYISDAVMDHDASLVPPVKDLVAPAKAVPGDILLPPGSHFLVIADDPSLPGGTGVVLDYLCQSPSDATNSSTTHSFMAVHSNARDFTALATTTRTPDPKTEPDGEAAMGKHTNTQGPLSISNVGLRYSNSVLSVLFDATVKLGPIEFSLLGFGIGIDLSTFNLRSLSGATPVLSLQGLAAEYNEPPLVIAGIFENLSSPGIIKYVGGISVSFDPYDFLAVGAYGEITNNGSTYKSVFIFAKLEGPLIEFEFAEVSGICGGFGYNSYLRYPSLAEIYNFPFVDNPSNDSLSKPDPLTILTSLTGTDPSNPNAGWVSDQEGSIWLAAGLKVKAFQTLSINAVVVLEFNPYVSLGIFADAVASMPASTGGTPPFYILYVELGIVATVDFQGGTLRVEASLSPNSFVLNPLCHLTGGFALCYWFAGSPYDGDWVFTVGGYHSAFMPPDHYPTPDRLKIYWGLGGGLSVTGEAYMAVTPKVCMLGGLLSAVLDAGPLGAYFDAHADLLITYKPFHFKGTAGVEIGVTFTLDLFICTLHISVDISAELSLYGPPFGGDVWVDFWVFGFSIHFGDDEAQQNALDINEFNVLLEQQHDPSTTVATAGASSTTPAPATSTNDHVLAIEKGRYIVNKTTTNTDVPEGANWIVKHQGFAFRVQSRFAIETSTGNGVAGVLTAAPIYAKPMQLVADKDPAKDQHITSTMSITITQTVDGKEEPVTFNQAAVIKKVPQALWGAYTTDEDPLLHGNQIPSLMDGNNGLTVDLIMGITLTAPPPLLSADLIKPFDAKDAMAQDIFTDTDHENGLNPALVPKPVFAQPDWNPIARLGADTDEIRWTTAQTAWRSPDDLGAGLNGKTWGLSDVASMWGGAMQWKESVAATFPTTLVDEIETYYVSAPFVGQ